MNGKRVLANDGIHIAGKAALEAAGFEVVTEKVDQSDLMTALPAYDGIIVRSATKVRADLIDACPNLSFIARGGVGMDNIDVDYARSQGRGVYNTPAASSQSVAELVIAHMVTVSRFLQISNLEMPSNGTTEFKKLKKQFAAGIELKGKTLGIIGIGRIGQAVARTALGMGMNVVTTDPFVEQVKLSLDIAGATAPVEVLLDTVPMDTLLAKSDFITLHVPSQDKPILGAEQFDQMKDSAIIVNASRGGTVDETALIAAIDAGKLAGAGLDVFVNEPTPDAAVLSHPKISVTPHIGASTEQAQINIGLELAEKIIAHFAS